MYTCSYTGDPKGNPDSASEVLEMREYKPRWGIVKVRTRGVQQEGKVVSGYGRSVMVWKRAHAPKRDLAAEVQSDAS